jgi:hypothetical protein
MSSAIAVPMKGMGNHTGAVKVIGTVTVSSQIKDPSIVFLPLPSCPVNRHAMKLGEQTVTLIVASS